MTKEINLLEDVIETTEQEFSATDLLVDVLQKTKDRQEEEEKLALAREHVKRLIEALLFASSDPLPLKKIREVTELLHPLKPRIIETLIKELRDEYDQQRRGFELTEIGEGYILRTRSEYGKYIESLYSSRRGEKLSNAATEVLAIIAYRQPITRVQIDAIRGVDSSGTLYSLIERGLIEVVGRLEAPGRPSLYGTTQHFLKGFGLGSLDELPHRDQLCKQADQLPQSKKAKKEGDKEKN